MRLNRFIASSGVCSRRQADVLIAQGRVQVNGVVMNNFACTVGQNDQVRLDGELLQMAPYQYIGFNKPAGYLTTMRDDRGRPTIYHLLPKRFHHLRPVGRLDYDSTGLLLLSNDGDFIYRLTHPSIKVAKCYLVSAKGLVTAKQLAKMKTGIILDNVTAFADARLLEYKNGLSWLRIVLYQGINRQIRRMLEYVSHPVVELQRVSHGPFELGDLPEGRFVLLNRECCLSIAASKSKLM